MRPTPINLAEAVIEPFWDPTLSGLKEWRIEPGTGHGLKVEQNWCWVNVSWTRRPKSGPALRMTRGFDCDLSGYDTLLVSVMAPLGTVFRMTAETDAGPFRMQAEPATSRKREHALSLPGARRLRTLTIELDAAGEGLAAGWLNWVGLQNRELLPRYLAQWQRFDDKWQGYLRPESYKPKFKPAHGLILKAEELAALRRHHDKWLAEHAGQSPFLAAAASVRGATPPEQFICQYANVWGDDRYNREREHGRYIDYTAGINAAVAGLVLEDRALLRLAARYALAIAACEPWDGGMICDFPGGTFDERCFVQSLCCFSVGLVLDLAGEMFTSLGRTWLLQRLAKEGIGLINFNTWAYDYIHDCNQLLWFTPGRLMAYLTLDQNWKRVRPYLEIAWSEMSASLERIILPDGGYPEGPLYFGLVAGNTGWSSVLYSRFAGRPFASVLPKSLRRCADFGELLASTDESTDMIPIGDAAQGQGLPLTLVTMANALPQSAWLRTFRKAAAREPGKSTLADRVLSWALAETLPAASPEPKSFVSLPEMGCLASTRRLGNEWVKLFLMGNKAGAGHAHEDKGSFVLEHAGETFALDPGMGDYSNPQHLQLKYCQWHNMLLPYGTAERPAPQNPLTPDVKPVGVGDARGFSARLNVTPGWEGWYRKWHRSWSSSQPDALTIRDEWELAQGEGVEFLWQTRLRATLQDGRVLLKGKRGQAILKVPPGCEARVEQDVGPMGVHHRVVFRNPAKAGTMEVVVQLS